MVAVTQALPKASCQHPNILQLTAVYDDEDTRCLFMELAEGGDLFDRIIEKVVFTEEEAKGAFAWWLFLLLVTGICSGREANLTCFGLFALEKHCSSRPETREYFVHDQGGGF